jgi:hypothetical protein
MKTKNEIITQLKTENPTIRVGSDQVGYTELTTEEYEATILEWADFELEKANRETELANIKANKLTAYQKMGLTQEEIDALMPPEPELLTGSN